MPPPASQTVAEPGTDAGPARDGRAGIHQQLPGHVVELIRVHRADEANVIGDRTDVRDEIGQLHAALAVRLERARSAHDAGGFMMTRATATIARVLSPPASSS